MAIPKEYQGRCIYHFTHIDNLESILKYGLLSTNLKQKKGIKHSVIAYEGIQDRRATMEVPCGPGGVVHDYAPLYFCTRSPMLYAVVTGKIADEQLIVYLEYPISIIEDYPSVFTDASANTGTPPNFYDDPEDLDKINWEIVDTWKWGQKYDVPGETSRKQAKMAEVLIHKRLDCSKINRIVVWNKSIADEVKRIYTDKGFTPTPVAIGEWDFYFVNDRRPPVTGPYFIKRQYEETVDDLIKHLGEGSSPTYDSLRELRDALRSDFNCLPETAELVGLESDNPLHTEDVADHTIEVVEGLDRIGEYQSLNGTGKLIVELAAYLHDIGKGPKSRWPGGRQRVDPDHPIKALPMLKRILSEEIRKVSANSVRLLCKLVCYHDLLGDIVGKGRRVEELEEIVEDERDLDMLIALGKADILAVNPSWWDEYQIENIQERVLATLKSRQDKE
jgi:HD superfamily phosphodiesterase